MGQAKGMTYEDAVKWKMKPVRVKPSNDCQFWGRGILIDVISSTTASVRLNGHRRPESILISNLLPWKAKEVVQEAQGRKARGDSLLIEVAHRAVRNLVPTEYSADQLELEHRVNGPHRRKRIREKVVKETFEDLDAFYRLEKEQKVLNALEQSQRAVYQHRSRTDATKQRVERMRNELIAAEAELVEYQKCLEESVRIHTSNEELAEKILEELKTSKATVEGVLGKGEL